jgi:hypothetical protein
MLELLGYILLSLAGGIFAALIRSPSGNWRLWFAEPRASVPKLGLTRSEDDDVIETNNDGVLLQEIKDLAERHETAALLSDLILKDGAGEWPPRSNHATATWPAALRPYRDIYNEMAPLLPTANVSLDDEVNRRRIVNFRSRFQTLLREQVDLAQVEILLKAAEAGQWDVFPRDTYNGFYACVAWCRHAYRYAPFLYPLSTRSPFNISTAGPPSPWSDWPSSKRRFSSHRPSTSPGSTSNATSASLPNQATTCPTWSSTSPPPPPTP